MDWNSLAAIKHGDSEVEMTPCDSALSRDQSNEKPEKLDHGWPAAAERCISSEMLWNPPHVLWQG